MLPYIKYLTTIICVLGISTGIYFLKKGKTPKAILTLAIVLSALAATAVLLLVEYT